MDITADSKSNKVAIGLCIGISLLIHVVLALALFSPAILSLFNPDKKDQPPKEKKKEVLIKLVKVESKPKPKIVPPKPKKSPPAQVAKKKPAPVPKLKDKPQKQNKAAVPLVAAKQQYARTTDDQTQGKPKEANLIGERDTIAASNKAVNADAPERAAINGEVSEFNEATNTKYQDGDLAHMNKGAKGEQEQKIQKPQKPQEEQDDKDQKEQKSSIVENTTAGADLEDKKRKLEQQKRLAMDEKKEVKKYLETSNKAIPLEQQAKIMLAEERKREQEKQKREEEMRALANKRRDAEAAKQKALAEARKKKLEQIKQQKAARAKQGFRSEAKATVFEGSISRRSKAGSRNVKSSPLGKYMATISKLVEQEWQRRCSMKADLIQPGTLRMRFLVDEYGKIHHVQKISQTYGSESNYFITFQAINSIKVKPMPSKVRSVQNGDPIEFIYTFAF